MPHDPRLSRRAVLTGAGVLAVGAVAGVIVATRPSPESSAATSTPRPTSSAGATGAPQRRFESTDLTVPSVTTWKTGTTAAGLLFVTQQVKGFNGLIMTEDGEPVWIEPTKANITDLKVQTYQGRPVLTYWTGKSSGGHGDGVGVILDEAYTEIARVSAGNGVEADLHEFTLTDRGTALLTVYETVPADLSAIDGPAKGHIYDCRVQEVDVASGEVLLDWKALDHIPVDETYLGLTQDKGHDGTTAGRAFDPYHLNSVDDDGDRLLVSARHTHAVYAIDRSSGEVIWRLGGRRSDFEVAKKAAFAWQHDVRRQSDGTLSLFDNHLYAAAEGHSRGMVFALDEDAMTATLVQEYAYDGHLGTAMGSTQVLTGGNVLVGWGTVPAATEFTAAGDPVWQATLGGISYRAYRHEWTAHPTTAPAVAAKTERGGVRVFASWNGATEVRRWRVLAAADSASAVQPAGEVAVSGFETSLLVPSAARVAVQALDASGQVLATSRTLAV
jgi:hypothetical protein